MNRHFYGSPAGIPLECLLNVTRQVISSAEAVAWTSCYSARIYRNELMLSGKYEMRSGSINAFFEGLRTNHHHICGHLTTDERLHKWRTFSPWSIRYFAPSHPWIRIKGIERKDAIMESDWSRTVTTRFRPCCLSDYCAEVSVCDSSWGFPQYVVAIHTYHLLGNFRSPTQ